MTDETATRDGLGPRLFSFGVITDTHVNQGEDDCNSPYESNRLANRRIRHVIRDLNGRDLAFVVNVGDLVHPLPAIPDLYARAAACFHEGVAGLHHPLYLTPGNHDVGDKPNDWAPAARVHEDHLALWDQHFGPQYQSFDHDGCHVVIINAQIINSGFAEEEKQRAWLEADLAANRGQRIFFHSHYPPYFTRPDEEENYDNIGEPGRSWLLGLLEEFAVEALFIGHVHNFWFFRHGVTDCYLLPSTAFVRLDYSEMHRVAPEADAEYGRNDKPKLGYFVVHVHRGGHVCEVVRTNGAVAEEGSAEPSAPARVEPVHPRLNRHHDFGFDMRQNWMETVEIPPTGGLDEFDRKEVRNDYPLMALWEMGVARVRIPMRDLLVPERVERLAVLREHGHRFTLFPFGAPKRHHRALIERHQDVLDAWEIGLNFETLERDIAQVGEAARAVDLPVYLSRLRSIDEQRAEAGKYYHAINQGFLANDRDQMASLLERPELSGALSGLVFRMTMEMPVWATVSRASEIATELGVSASVHLRMTGPNPAVGFDNEHVSAGRIAEAMAAAAAFDNVTVYADTLIDFDRGYFPRAGVLDRRFNPRPPLHVVRHLNAALDSVTGPLKPGHGDACDGGRYVVMQSGAGKIVLALPDAGVSEITVPLDAGSATRVDLLDGTMTPLAGKGGHAVLAVSQAEGFASPILIHGDGKA
ncbi:MAG: serine/threonine protein phosphatase [Rhodospirillaceae bacterium]|nr:serine/threonine protein phosphatase [Rhodospirillaceae bacterium]